MRTMLEVRVQALIAVAAIAACAEGSSLESDLGPNSPAERDLTSSPSQTIPTPDAGKGKDAASSSSSSSSSSASSSSSSSSSTGGSSTSSSGGPCTPPVPGGVCDTLPQCGCGSGLKCDVNGGGGITACIPAGSVGQYQACASQNDCQKGLTCLDGACKPFCDSNADCPGAGRACVPVYSGGGVVPGFQICTSGCDLMNPASACGPNLTCSATTYTTADCTGPAQTGIGANACAGGAWLCAPGHICQQMTVNGTFDCVKWCKSGGNDCPAPQTCKSLPGGFVTVGAVAYGVCG